MNFLRWARTEWDRVAAWVLIAFGGLAIVLGWNGVSGRALTAQQIPYVVSGGIGGLFLLGVGAMLWLSADLRDEWRKLDTISRLTEHAAVTPPPTISPDDPFAALPAVGIAGPEGVPAIELSPDEPASPRRNSRRAGTPSGRRRPPP
jgi:hypothetical protein